MLCEVCLVELSGPKLDLGFHPLCDDLEIDAENVAAKKFHQEIQLCQNCLTAHQLHQVPKEELFKPSYHYRSSLTKDVLKGMEALATDALKSHPKKANLLILDVGCNDGALLGLFKSKVSCTTIGIDPTDAIMDQSGAIDFTHQTFFNRDIATFIRHQHGSPDLITFTNVFAHIENLPKLLQALVELVGPNTVVIIENHYLGAILDRSQFDTFYHEHPRTYSARSFQFIADKLGMKIKAIEFPSRYGGNIRVTMDSSPSQVNPLIDVALKKESDLLDRFKDLQATFDFWRVDALQTLSTLAASGQIYGKSLPGRAVMLISSLGITSNQMPKIFEQPTSPKVGFYVPCTSIQIASDDDLIASGSKKLIVWSWHIIDEICEYLEAIGYEGEIWVPLPRLEKYKTI